MNSPEQVIAARIAAVAARYQRVMAEIDRRTTPTQTEAATAITAVAYLPPGTVVPVEMPDGNIVELSPEVVAAYGTDPLTYAGQGYNPTESGAQRAARMYYEASMALTAAYYQPPGTITWVLLPSGNSVPVTPEMVATYGPNPSSFEQFAATTTSTWQDYGGG